MPLKKQVLLKIWWGWDDRKTLITVYVLCTATSRAFLHDTIIEEFSSTGYRRLFFLKVVLVNSIGETTTNHYLQLSYCHTIILFDLTSNQHPAPLRRTFALVTFHPLSILSRVKLKKWNWESLLRTSRYIHTLFTSVWNTPTDEIPMTLIVHPNVVLAASPIHQEIFFFQFFLSQASRPLSRIRNKKLTAKCNTSFLLLPPRQPLPVSSRVCRVVLNLIHRVE